MRRHESDHGWNRVCACVIAVLCLNSSLMAAGQPIYLSFQLISSVMVLCNKHLRLKSIWRDRSTQLRLLTVAEPTFPLKQLQMIETQLHLYPRSILKCHVHIQTENIKGQTAPILCCNCIGSITWDTNVRHAKGKHLLPHYCKLNISTEITGNTAANTVLYY